MIASLFAVISATSAHHRHRLGRDAVTNTDGDITWSFPDAERIRFTVTARTQGWVAVGVSKSGAMKGADLAVVRQVNGVFIVEDRFADDYVVPSLDRVQNVRLVAAVRNATHTVATVERMLDACDRAEDLSVPVDTPVYVLWAFGVSDEFLVAHRPTARRTQLVTLRGGGAAGPVVPKDPGQVSMGMTFNTSRVPPGDQYLCMSAAVPAGAKGGSGVAYLIGYAPILTSPYVHHFVAYACDAAFVPYSGVQPCMGFDLTSGCGGSIVALWAPGAPAEYLPEDLAFPVGGAMVLQIHYSNPAGMPSPDTSGMTFHFTPQKRKLDVGTFVFGVPHIVPFNQALLPPAISLPPHETSIVVSSVCPSAITRQLPSDLTVYGIAAHMHLRGKRMTIMQVSNGVARKILDTGMGYDFNFQSRTPMANVTLRRGDVTFTECTYSTLTETQLVVGGEATSNEMCYGFALVSPPLGPHGESGGCVSLPSSILPATVRAAFPHASMLGVAMGFGTNISRILPVPDSEFPPYPDPPIGALSSTCAAETAALLQVAVPPPTTPEEKGGGSVLLPIASPPSTSPGGVSGGASPPPPTLSPTAVIVVAVLAAVCGVLLLAVVVLLVMLGTERGKAKKQAPSPVAVYGVGSATKPSVDTRA